MKATISRRFMRVWQRNYAVYRRTWKINFLPPLFEPLFYLLAFGVGLSALIEGVPYRGEQIPYIEFIAPSLLSVAIMYNAFFETSYASFVRMYYQKTFDAMLATPLSLEDIIAGEIAWAATKACGVTLITQLVISGFGLVAYPHGLLIPLLALLGGVAFAAVGMLFTSIVPNIETFNIPVFLFITPMFLFSGTFFPLGNLPGWAQILAQCLPLTHLVALVRGCALGRLDPDLLYDAGYLLLFALLLFPLALRRMRRRLIR